MIKTFFFSISCMFLTLSVSAQSGNLKTQLELLQYRSAYKYSLDSTGFSKIKNAKFFTKSGDIGMFNINNKNIHIVDFNDDGQNDIIYQDNRQYQTAVLLAKKDKNFVEIWSGSGALVDVKKGEKTTVYVLISAIGCLNVNLLSELIIQSDNAIIENVLAINSETKLNEIDKIFERKIVSGILRTLPIIDNKKKTDPCTGDLKTGNKIRTIENKEVTVVKKQNDWLLVVLKEVDQSIIGWIKV